MHSKQLALLNILVAEDDPDDAEMVIDAIKKSDYFGNAILVNNGEELVEYLNSHKNCLPDVILTDLNMPKKSGFEALEEISKNDKLNEIPVFVYSTSANPVTEEKCKALGVKCFLIKPFNFFEYSNIPKLIADYLGTHK